MDPDQRLHQKNVFPILVVESNKDHQLLIGYCLRAKIPQAEPIFADNPEDALSFLGYSAAEPRAFPWLVLQALLLPQLSNGLALLTEIRSRYPLLPVVVLSSQQEAGLVEKVYLAGAHSLLVKPASLTEWELHFHTLNEYWFNIVTLPIYRARETCT
ncbi:response regulator [Spirosoma sp. KCTC 42546]|uniref:response regulator n=1 Tax=Spirosoma sp. KCTC 42546 TaxID=2520506 RepID=UPI0011577C44|nr:response regulator [Spirosoma sp. KCTC 42546]QDK80217.1 response regulator [Spirosoma sp. KCTC 42546]